jgi:hypothetical protein
MNNLVDNLIKQFAFICLETNSEYPFYEIKYDSKIIHIHRCKDSENQKYLHFHLCLSNNLFEGSLANCDTNTEKIKMKSLPAFRMKDVNELFLRVKPFLLDKKDSNFTIDGYCYPFITDTNKFRVGSKIEITPKDNQNKLSVAEQKKLDNLIESIYRYMTSDIKVSSNESITIQKNI